jgi:hypothetical protein
MAVPQSAVFTSSEIMDMVAYLVDLVSDGGFTGSGFTGTVALAQLLRSES